MLLETNFAAEIGRPAAHVEGMNELVIWYNGGCLLCRREILLMCSLSRKSAIDFVYIASSDTTCLIYHADLFSRFHAKEDGAIVFGAAAFTATWRSISLLRPLGLLARNRWALAVPERLYLSFLRVQHRLQHVVGMLDV